MSRESRASVSSRFCRLIHSFRGRNLNSSQQDDLTNEPIKPPTLPFLPTPRPWHLTPTASRESLVALGNSSNLPPELRRRVLIAAFGERTLHLDLRLNYPLLPLDHRSVNFSWSPDVSTGKTSASYEHGGGTAPLSSCYPSDRTAIKTWRWWSSVCHSQLPPGCEYAKQILSKGVALYRYPNHDTCLCGDGAFCQLWSPQWVDGPGRCAIGAMGWLVVCRQAYVEGIDVLYSTNTFFIESLALFDALFYPGLRTHHLLLPERLASITSLELRWEVLLFGQVPAPLGDRHHHHQSDEDRLQLASHLYNLYVPFPNLRKLVISFSDQLYHDSNVPPANALDDINHVLLRPLANAITRLPLQAQLQHIVVELPSNVFITLCEAAERKALGLEMDLEQGGRSWGDGQGAWLRYPTSAPLALMDEPYSTSGSGHRNQLDDSRSRGNSGFFYHIKAGVTSDVFWDHNGRARSRARIQVMNGVGQ